MIDSIIPINFRFHNTLWVVAHFHTYLMLMRRLLGARLRRPPARARRAGRTASRGRARSRSVGLMLVGGYGLVGTWFVSGALGVPRRYASSRRDGRLQPRRQHLRAGLRARLPRPALRSSSRSPAPPGERRRYVLVERTTPGRARRYQGSQPARRAGAARDRGAASEPPASRSRARPSSASALAACVVALVAFFPQVVRRLRGEHRYHHLDHAGQFLFGVMLGLVLGSAPAVSRPARRSARRSASRP